MLLLPPPKVICGQTQGLDVAQDVLCALGDKRGGQGLRTAPKGWRFQPEMFCGAGGQGGGGRDVYGMEQEKQEEVGTVSPGPPFS